MVYENDEAARLKQLRTVWGWVFVSIWVVGWWSHLTEVRDAALAMPCPEGLGTTVGDFFMGKGQTCRNNIDGNFNSGLFLTCLTAPIFFLVGNAFAKWRLAQLKASEETALREQERQRRTAHETSIEEMSTRSKTEQVTARMSSNRFEIITRLGAVDDQLVVLENETSAENVKLIKLNIVQSIRDIHAKFKEDELATMYGSDEGLRKRVDRTLAEMRRLDLGGSRFYADLSEMFRRSARPGSGSWVSVSRADGGRPARSSRPVPSPSLKQG